MCVAAYSFAELVSRVVVRAPSVPRRPLASQNPFWDAVRLLYPGDMSAAVFLLPYLLRDALGLDNTAVSDTILAEIVAVLSDGDYSAPVPASASASARAALPPRAVGFLHRARQAVFSVLDTLTAWEEMDQRARAAVAGGSGVVPSASVGSAGRRGRRSNATSVQWLLQSIPQRLLAGAALGCNAHARALRHLEVALMETFTQLREPLPNFPLPHLPRKDVSFLQTVYSQLDEPDGLAGILALRTVSDCGGGPVDDSTEASESTSVVSGAGARGTAVAAVTNRTVSAEALLAEQIIDCEHDGRWSEALVCFEQAILRRQAAAVGLALASQPAGDVAGSATPAPLPVPGPLDGGAGVDTASLPDEELLHTGILRCLQNTGHVETALHRAVGVLHEKPRLATAVAPFAVDAAWKLGQWDSLRTVLQKHTVTHALPSLTPVGGGGGGVVMSLAHGGAVGGGGASQLSEDDVVAERAQDFQTLFGELMLHFHESPGGSPAMSELLRVCRFNVMASLSAASMESYNR